VWDGWRPEGRIVTGAALVAEGRPDDAGLCRPPDIAMMEATDFGNLQYRARLRPLDGSHVWRILLEREVSSSAVVIREVAGQDAAQVLLVENEDMVQTLAPDRTDEPFHERILQSRQLQLIR